MLSAAMVATSRNSNSINAYPFARPVCQQEIIFSNSRVSGESWVPDATSVITDRDITEALRFLLLEIEQLEFCEYDQIVKRNL